MRFDRQMVALATLMSTCAFAVPLNKRNAAPRNKSYNVVNVGGEDSPSPAPATTIEATKTVAIVNPGPTYTVEVTVPAAQPAIPSPTSSASLPNTGCAASSSPSSSGSISTTATPSCTSASSSSSSSSAPTPDLIYITVIVPADEGPYHDDGMWHTRYKIKTLEPYAALATPVALAPSRTMLPVLETPGLGCNATTKA